VATVHALARKPVSGSSAKVRATTIDIQNETSVEQAAASVASDSKLDLVIVATGVLHRGTLQPEKSMSQIDADSLAEVYSTNTIGPILVAKHFLPLLAKDRRSVFAVLSARVGSISDNRLGGWISYRASKAALNMALKTLSIEHARRWPLSIVAALHPGTVDTGLSQPFSSRVPDKQLFDADYAAGRLLSVVDQLRPEDTGGFFAWDGSPIPW
jgi:NAD(P)-dependent dehydrogenase (short-subunit alcohol dehydrogenase family)